MGIFAVGEVVVMPFPISDLSSKKLRPAVVVAVADYDDLIFCQITSKDRSEHGAIKLASDNFQSGSLPIVSYARPNKLFTGNSSIIVNSYGMLNDATKRDLLNSVGQLLKD